MLDWKCAKAPPEVCTCSTGSVHMLDWIVYMAYESGHMFYNNCSVHMLYWTVNIVYWRCTYAQLDCAHAQLKCAYTQLKYTHTLLEVCTCSTGSMHVLYWSLYNLYKCVHALLKCAHPQLGVWGVHMFDWEHAQAQLWCAHAHSNDENCPRNVLYVVLGSSEVLQCIFLKSSLHSTVMYMSSVAYSPRSVPWWKTRLLKTLKNNVFIFISYRQTLNAKGKKL